MDEERKEERTLPRDKTPKGKKNTWQLIIPIIIAIIFVGVFLYLEERNKLPEEPYVQPSESELNKPVSPSENPRREEELDPRLGCAGPPAIETATLEQSDPEWLIKRDGEANILSLGKYRIAVPIYLVLDIPKLWLYFSSEELSNRDDNLYGLESSYVSEITLIVNGYERKIRLGGDEYMFIELSNYPLGDLYPYDKETNLDFEFVIELKCKNLERGNCLDNEGKSLDYVNNININSKIRIFAVGCQEFSRELDINARFKYGD